MGSLILYLLCGLCAIIFSILAWRLKNHTYWLIGVVLTSIIVLVSVFSWQYALLLMLSREMFSILFFGSFLVIPIIFLVKAKMDTPSEGFDGSTPTGAVTEEYLDEVINAPEEDIDFEDGLDLR